MDFITPIFEICLTCWDRSAKYRLPIKHFRKSLENLRVERGRLVDVSNDVKGRIDREKLELHQVPTDEVSGWCTRVEGICNEVDVILQKGEEAAQKNCLGGHCPTNCRSRYKLAKEADDVKERVTREVDIGHSFKDGQVTFKPYEASSAVGHQEPTVGMDVNFRKVREWVEDETVRSIGLFGAGGVGKTTLIKRVYNHFLRVVNPNSHFVIWAEVSQTSDIEQIQKKIWKQLRFSDEKWKANDKQERAIKMQDFLREKNFMLFLDNLWKRIDLAEIGIPHPKPNSTLVFSTRLEQVCGHMQASTSLEANRRMKVECLAPEDALLLFQQKVGEETWTANPQIPEFAETLVKECQYLPLALTTVAKAMVFKKEPRQWDQAIKDLRSNLAKFEGMQEVLKILKYSFDALPDERHKKCFLYCSLFPEDFEIGKYDLMDLLLGEGYFDECDIHDARYYCEDVLEKLTTSCLLEEISFDNLKLRELGKDFSLEFYKMHDLVREMASWVAREQYEKKIIMLKDQETIGLHEFKDVEMISVMQQGTRIQDILPTPLPYCLNLSTLILTHGYDTDRTRFPGGFFSSMPSLKVLDLSWNKWLSVLGGDIGELTNLQYLNILATSITKLPEEFKKLVNLKYLFLNREVDMDGVPEEIVSSIIPSLRVFHYKRKSGKLLKLLRGMDVQNSEVSLTLVSNSELKQLLTSPGLQSCLRYLALVYSDDLVSITFSKSSVKIMKYFELLVLGNCPNLEEISIRISSSRKGKEGEENEKEEEERGVESLILGFPVQDYFHNLRRVSLTKCNKLLHLTSLIYYAPYLDTLAVGDCESMREVVRMGDVPKSQAVNIFSCLRMLVLGNLPSLKSICGSPLPFPSLRFMSCLRCDLLRKLPFCADGSHRHQFNKLQKIEGEVKWWNRLEWDDVATQQLLTVKFFTSKFFP